MPFSENEREALLATRCDILISTHQPSATAIVFVVDLQTGMFDGVLEPPLYDADALVARVRTVMDWARRTGRRIAFIRHDGSDGDPLAPGAPGWPVWPALGQAAEDPTFAKSEGNAFSNLGLVQWVAERGADEVVLLGAQTDYCVAATVKGALAAGLTVTVVSDAHSTVDSRSEAAPEIIARHNEAFAAAGVKLATVKWLTGT